MKLQRQWTWRSGVLLVIFAATLAFLVNWWIMRPKWAADRFMELAVQGRVQEADSMLVGKSSIDLDDTGVSITAVDGGTFTVHKNQLPLKGMESFYYQPRPSNVDYFAGRYHFPLVTSGPVVRSGVDEPIVVSAISTTSGIIIVSVK